MITIRRGVSADVPAIMAMIREFVIPPMHAVGNRQWGDDYPNELIFEEDVIKGYLFVTVMDDDEIVGVGALTCDQCPEYAQCGLDISIPVICPHRLAAHPKCAGKGIGRMLMLHAETVCREHGYDRIRVDTNKINVAAAKLFVGLEYSFMGEISLELRPGMTFLCYEKLISHDAV